MASLQHTVDMELQQPQVACTEDVQADAVSQVVEANAEERALPPWQPPPRARQSRKRERDVEALSAKVERLEKSAQQEGEIMRDMAAELETAAAEFRKQIESTAVTFHKQQETLTASRKLAAKARQELADLQMPAGREKPASPVTLFMKEIRPTLMLQSGGGSGMKKIAALWAALSEDEKKRYKDAFAVEMREYKEWACSDEGRAILARRQSHKATQNDNLRIYCGGEALATAKALAAVRACVQTFSREFGEESSQVEEDSDESPAKRAKIEPDTPPKKQQIREQLQAVVTATLEPATSPVASPIKHRSAGRSSARSQVVAVSPAIEEEVLQEASGLSLSAQLINLAGRPEVQALKKSSQELLNALRANDGIVNAAKRYLIETPM